MRGLFIGLLVAIASEPLLVSASVTFGNDYISLTHATGITIGTNVGFTCELQAEDEHIIECQIYHPGGVFTIDDNGNLLDDNGNPAAGYSALEPANGCGVHIDSVREFDVGDWQCRIQRSNGATPFISAVYNLRTNGEVLPPDARLPEHISPNTYNVELVTVWEPEWIIDGRVEVDFTAELGTSYDGDLYLHINDIHVDEASVTIVQKGAGNIAITEHIYDYERDLWIVKHEIPAVAATYSAILTANYIGQLRDLAQGFYRDSYIDVNTGEPVFMVATQFESRGARRAFPCMDEPNRKATFTTKVAHPNNLVAQGNMPIINTDAVVDGYPGYMWTEFDTTVVMSSYLVAWTVSDYTSFTGVPQANGVEHVTWARYDAIDDGLGDFAANVVAPGCIEAYEVTFGVDYPLPKLEQIAPPSKGGAMENWGLITYGESILLIDEDHSSCDNLFYMVDVNAHEIAHQWFGDFVTCDWWTYLWLNEAFAEYVSIYGTDYVAPYMRAFDGFAYFDLKGAMEVDSVPDSPAMSDVVGHPQEANFGSITYKKGGSILRMTESFLTQATWLKGLNTYLNANAYGNTVPDDLFYHWNEAAIADGTLDSDKDVKTILETWTLQNNYPVVTVTRDYTAQTASLTQERFLTTPDNSGNTHDYQWWIPITFSSVGDALSDFDNTYNAGSWFPPTQETLVVTTGSGDAPIVFNVQNMGFYRVNYDTENWNRIRDALVTDFESIHNVNRAQLISDSYELARAGVLPDYLTAQMMVEYLSLENDANPLLFAYDIDRDLRRTVVKPDDADALESLIAAQFVSIYARIGMEEDAADTFTENYVQQTAIKGTCSYDESACTADAVAQFNAWMSVPNPDDLATNPVNKHGRGTIYCTAIRNGGTTERQFLQERASNNRNPQERSNINNALGCIFFMDSLVQHLNKVLRIPGAFSAKGMAENMSTNPKATAALKAVYDQPDMKLFNEQAEEMLGLYLNFEHDESSLDLAESLVNLFEGQLARKSVHLRKAVEQIKMNMGH